MWFSLFSLISFDSFYFIWNFRSALMEKGVLCKWLQFKIESLKTQVLKYVHESSTMLSSSSLPIQEQLTVEWTRNVKLNLFDKMFKPWRWFVVEFIIACYRYHSVPCIRSIYNIHNINMYICLAEPRWK